MKQAEIDAGQVPGVTTAEAQRIREFEAEVRELRRANEILKDGISVFRCGGARPQAEVAEVPTDVCPGRQGRGCTVERLMRAAGIQDIRRAETDRPADLVKRAFTATAPNQIWVAGLTVP